MNTEIENAKLKQKGEREPERKRWTVEKRENKQ